MDDGWSVKKLIREIMLSRAYQLSSEHSDANYAADPDNTLVWRMNRRRLDAEAIRDAVLAVSGQLDLTRPAGSLDADDHRRRNRPPGQDRRPAARRSRTAAPICRSSAAWCPSSSACSTWPIPSWSSASAT